MDNGPFRFLVFRHTHPSKYFLDLNLFEWIYITLYVNLVLKYENYKNRTKDTFTRWIH